MGGVYTYGGVCLKRERLHRMFVKITELEQRSELFYFPGLAGAEKLVEVAGAALSDDVLDLLIHYILVARQVVPGAEHADGRGESGPMLHVREKKSVGGTRVMRVVHDKVRLG